MNRPRQALWARSDGCYHDSVNRNLVMQRRLQSARHAGAGTTSPIASCAQDPIRPARPDRFRAKSAPSGVMV